LIYIGNTDAEGRLALADAFMYVRNEWKSVKRMIDMATLTVLLILLLFIIIIITLLLLLLLLLLFLLLLL